MLSMMLSFSLSSCAKRGIPFSAYPLQNPQGVYFESDPEFVSAYMRYMNASQSNERPESAVSILNLESVGELEEINPVDAGWEVKTLPAGKTDLEEFLDNSVETARSFVTDAVKKVQDSAEAVKNVASKQFGFDDETNKNSSRNKTKETSRTKIQQSQDELIQDKKTPDSQAQSSSNESNRNDGTVSTVETIPDSGSGKVSKKKSRSTSKKSKSHLSTGSKEVSQIEAEGDKLLPTFYTREKTHKLPFCAENCSRIAIYSTYPVVGSRDPRIKSVDTLSTQRNVYSTHPVALDRSNLRTKLAGIFDAGHDRFSVTDR